MATASSPLFTSLDAKRDYDAAYRTTLALWGSDYECLDVSTRFGSTHVIATGPKDAPPLVLLHGLGVSSTMWFPNVAALSQSFRTLAIDVIGDAGKSVPGTPPRNRLECAQWLAQVLDALHVARAHVAGLSYGAFLTLNFAVHAPDRVNRIVLLAPAACFKRVPVAFWWRAISLKVLPMRSVLNAFMRWTSVRADASSHALIDQMLVNVRHCRVQLQVAPGTFSDEDLHRVSASTLLLVGEREVMCDPRAAVERATRLMPHIEAEVVPNAGHFLSFDQPVLVNERILRFLAQ